MSGALDEDTVRTVNRGRETVGAVLSSAQGHLQKIFILFVLVLVGTIWALQTFVWDLLKQDLLYEQMDLTTAEATEVVAVTPFDVILLQVKVGIIIGVVVCLPVLLYYSRGALKQRGIWPDRRVARWKLVAAAGLALLLFVGGLAYGYEFFFPIMFNFLAENAVNAGFEPTYSIVKWTEFILFLTLSFGLAAQLPLAMSGLALLGVVRYETFRDKWRYAVLGIFALGALFSPPDPFTQIMWAVPLVTLYAFSLGVTKFVVLTARAGANVPVRTVVRERWNVLAGVLVLAGGGTYAYLTRGGLAATNDLLARIGSRYRFPTAGELGIAGLSPAATAAVLAAGVALLVGLVVLFYLRIKALESYAADVDALGAEPVPDAEATAGETAASVGEPASIDIDALSAPAVRAAPPEAFADLSEGEALEHAERAMEEGDAEKAELVLERFDEAEDIEPEEVEADDESDPITSTAAGMADAFTEDETTEDDIGGYYYDIRFILDSLTSKAIWIVAVFMAVLGGSFVYLYSGGIGDIRDAFLSSMPPGLAEEVNIVTLHPVEALIFEVKFSALLAAVAVLPLVVYFAWPAIEERGITTGDRSILGVWGGTIILALVGGTLVGFFYIAPAIIGFLATDALTSAMVIAYRINNFGWLVIFTTVGIGILVEIPVTMVLFHRGRIVSYTTMRRHWRVVVLGFFAVAGLVSPKGVFTMLILAIPASFAFGVGLGLLWLYTRITGTRTPKAKGEAAD
ncbi:MAG: twin-arginine translocase subunit TatC [Haloarculaceae archaeon]